MYHRLTQLYWFSQLPQHPEWLPTFAPLLLGLTIVLLSLGGLAGLPFLLLLAPLYFICCTFLPWSRTIAALLLAMEVLILVFLPTVDAVILRQMAVLTIVILLGLWARRELRRQEWQWASQKM